MAEHEDDGGLRDRLSKQGEEALGRLAEELAGNPLVAGALSRAFQAREKAAQAQETAMGALGLPSAGDVERLTRRLRSVSQRLEGIEDALDRLDLRLGSLATIERLDDRLESLIDARQGPEEGSSAVEARLEEVVRDLAALREVVAPAQELPPRGQERLSVSDPAASAGAARLPGTDGRAAGPGRARRAPAKRAGGSKRSTASAKRAARGASRGGPKRAGPPKT